MLLSPVSSMNFVQPLSVSFYKKFVVCILLFQVILFNLMFYENKNNVCISNTSLCIACTGNTFMSHFSDK